MLSRLRAIASHPRAPQAWRVLLLCAFAACWHPATQCVWLRVLTPRITSTMVGSACDSWRETGRIGWVDHRGADLDALPAQVPEAFVASEDQRFYAHHGFDWDAIQAAYAANQGGGSLRGGSTISQQVARNVFLWQGRSWLRKGLEAWYTLWLELIVPKHRILELYLDVAEMGPQTFGIEAAAHRWYSVPAAKLSARQAATIAAILPAPTTWTPRTPRVRKHVEWILDHRLPLGQAPARK
jgi:monofunctional biosynthetic peptidoglycan transglycosylase